MPLSKSYSHDPTISHPIKWSPTGFVYLGIKITPNLESLNKSIFAPIFKNIRSDLDRWCNLTVSLVGRVHLVKINILPRLLYPFQMLPVLIANKALKQLRGFIISFIWQKKRQRLRYNFLTLPSRCGGLAAPDIKLYQLSAHLCSSRSASKIFYSILIKANTDSSDKTRVLWEKDFGEEIQITDWEIYVRCLPILPITLPGKCSLILFMICM